MDGRDVLIATHKQTDAELSRLVSEHRDLDDQLAAIESQRWLTAREQARVKQMKRQKLQRRDRIDAILDRYR